MNQKNIFALAVRILGLVSFYRGLEALPIAGAQFCNSVPGGELAGIVGPIVKAAWPLLVAYWLIRGAPLLIRIAYPGVGTRDA